MNKHFTRLSSVKQFLCEGKEEKLTFCEKFFPKYNVFTLNKDNTNIFLRIEELDYDFFGLNIKRKPIGGIDIIKNYEDKKLIIDWYMINNKLFAQSHNFMYDLPLSEKEEKDLMNTIFNYAEIIGKKERFNKIELDVHENLKYYKNNKLEDFGFQVTNKRASDNPYWVVTEKNIN